MNGEQLEAAWRLAREPVAAGVVGVWAAIGVAVAVFIVRFRTDWGEGVKAGAALVAAGVALGLFVCCARRNPMVRHQRVGDVLVNGEGLRHKRVKVNGYVACGLNRHPPGTDDYRFKIKCLPSQPDVALEVRYTGLVPDTFVAGNEVVIDGGLAVMAKCGNRLPIRCAEGR